MVLVSSCLCNIWKNHMMLQILDSGEQINLQHFRPIKPLGSGDTKCCQGPSDRPTTRPRAIIFTMTNFDYAATLN